MRNHPWRRVFGVLTLARPIVAIAQTLTLAEAEACLEAGNREIITARQQVGVTGSGVILAGAVPNPTLSASVTSINPSRGIGAGRSQDKQVDSIVHLEQLVERGSKRELRIASQHDLDEVRRQQRLALHVAWFASQFWETQTP
jgi:cobalt-zinc-cadmium efflux system outer membrane protein